MQKIRTIGDKPATFTFSDLRREYRGFLSVYSFETSDRDHRFEVLDRGDAAVVLPVNFATREIYMIEQPRVILAYGESETGKASLARAKNTGADIMPFAIDADACTVFELPAGMIDAGETDAQAAGRELQEETGLVVAPEKLERVLQYYPSCGGSTERISVFIARVDETTAMTETHGDGNEIITVWKMSFEEAWDLLKHGRIKTASSMIMLRELKIRDLEKKT
jgi:ADP-ribose pyrophosphatase